MNTCTNYEQIDIKPEEEPLFITEIKTEPQSIKHEINVEAEEHDINRESNPSHVLPDSIETLSEVECTGEKSGKSFEEYFVKSEGKDSFLNEDETVAVSAGQDPYESNATYFKQDEYNLNVSEQKGLCVDGNDSSVVKPNNTVILSQTENVNLKCDICNKPVSHKISITKYLNQLSGEESFACNFCGNYLKCLKHFIPQHTYIKPLTCNVCMKSFSNKYHFTRHKVTHLDVKPFKCNVCMKSFTQESYLLEHVHVHTNDNKLTCDICLKSFFHRKILISHIRTHTNKNQFKCNICMKTFKTKRILFCHLRLHRNEKPFTCDCCMKSFAEKSSLKIHMRTHTNEKPFTCNFCNKSFRQNSNLVCHIRHHTNERPYKCNKCTRAFTHKSSLAYHTLTHENEKPFKCDLCTMSFVLKRSLIEHRYNHSNVKPFKCNVCMKSFKRRRGLREHTCIERSEK